MAFRPATSASQWLDWDFTITKTDFVDGAVINNRGIVTTPSSQALSIYINSANNLELWTKDKVIVFNNVSVVPRS